MKALSTKQPWAWLIVHGYKDVENRSWHTPFRGEFLVHAGKDVDKIGYEHVRREHPEIPLPPLVDLPRGGIVGRATLLRSVEWCASPWFEGPIGFVLERARAVPFRACRGMLGFFEVPDALYEDPNHD